MIKVKMEIGLDIENPNDKAATFELRKWKELQRKGEKKTYLSEQKTVFMAGLYLHAIAPQLCNKLAQNLAAASMLDLEHFTQSIFATGAQEVQLDGVLDKLGEIEALINATIDTSRPLPSNELKAPQIESQQAPVAPRETKQQAAPVVDAAVLNDQLKKLGKIKSNNIF